MRLREIHLLRLFDPQRERETGKTDDIRKVMKGV